jgi:hypothetical protein
VSRPSPARRAASPGPVAARLRRGTGSGARAGDRLELLSLVLCALLVVLAVPVGLAVATTVGADAAADARRQHEERSRVTAVLTADADPVVGLQAWAPATWTAPDGTARAGEVPAPAGSRAGQAVRIWAGPDGARTGRPLTRAGVRLTTAVAGTVTALLVACSALALHLATGAALDRSRARRWAREWAEVEPVWSGR